MKKLLTELRGIKMAIMQTNMLIDIMIKKISLKSKSPSPWLTSENHKKAEELKIRYPDIYDTVTEILKMFLN